MIDRVCISLTSKCQLNCIYCHFDKHINKTKISDMLPENLIKILKNILHYVKQKDISIFKIGLVGSGEPLLRFDLVKKAIEFTKSNDTENRLSFYTISNGICLNKEKINWFYENRDKIKLCFSLDGSKKVHDFCRKFFDKRGSFDDVMKNIAIYKDIFGKSPSINSTVHKQTLDNASNELKFFADNFSEVCFSRLVDEKSKDFDISKTEFDSFLALASRTNLELRQLRIPKKYDCTMYGQLCGVGRTNLFYANGKIYPCGRFIGMEKFELGDELDTLENVEKRISCLTPVEDGKCYFDENVEDKV